MLVGCTTAATGLWRIGDAIRVAAIVTRAAKDTQPWADTTDRCLAMLWASQIDGPGLPVNDTCWLAGYLAYWMREHAEISLKGR